MKKLILVRHGKSSWEFDLPDEKRPLKKRGITDAGLVSEEFITMAIEPDKVFSSPANRAFSTCEIFAKKLQFEDSKIQIVKNLYDFQGEKVISFVKNLPDDHNIVMIFGHNHAFTSISNIFGDELIENLPTSGLIAIDFDVNSWQEIKSGKTVLSIFPRDLK